MLHHSSFSATSFSSISWGFDTAPVTKPNEWGGATLSGVYFPNEEFKPKSALDRKAKRRKEELTMMLM